MLHKQSLFCFSRADAAILFRTQKLLCNAKHNYVMLVMLDSCHSLARLCRPFHEHGDSCEGACKAGPLRDDQRRRRPQHAQRGGRTEDQAPALHVHGHSRCCPAYLLGVSVALKIASLYSSLCLTAPSHAFYLLGMIGQRYAVVVFLVSEFSLNVVASSG